MSASVRSKAFPAEAKTRAAQAGVEVPVHIVGAMEGKFIAADVLLEYCPKRHRQEVHAYIAEVRAAQEPSTADALIPCGVAADA